VPALADDGAAHTDLRQRPGSGLGTPSPLRKGA